MKLPLTMIFLEFISFTVSAQPDRGPEGFPQLIMTEIAGAPKLGNPILITGKNSQPLISQGFGLAAPAFYDWDGDGLKDLLIGEYGSGAEFGRHMGNFIRVYLNEGTESQPSFSGNFNYANPPFEILSNGTPYSVDQYCCMGFTPDFLDLNNDGYLDMISGQYYGEVISFQGSAAGFLPGIALKQDGNPRKEDTMASQAYWLYSSVDFGDLTEDAKQDLIVGGWALRISENSGTQSDPKFEQREFLLDVTGNPLKVYQYTSEELKGFKYIKPYIGGDSKLSPQVVDWDNDGVLDLLVTNSYYHKGLDVVIFFRGIKVNDNHLFEQGVPLFVAKDGQKSFPGSSPHVFVTDWNDDEVNDLLIGVSVTTLHGEFNSVFSWNWEKDMGVFGVGRDPGFFKDHNPTSDMQWLLKDVKLPHNVTPEDFVTMRRQGYVYVMLGNKN